VSSTRFEHPSVLPQEDLYLQFYGISFMRPYKQSGRRQDVFDTHMLPSTRLLTRMHEKYHKIACTLQLFLRMNLGCPKHVEDTIIELNY